MPRGWEGNRRSGVALAMRHDSSGLSTNGLNGREWEMSTRLRSSCGMAPFTFFTIKFQLHIRVNLFSLSSLTLSLSLPTLLSTLTSPLKT